MKIYTKRGDHGSTSLLDGANVFKDNLRIRAYGALDELNSVLGLALAEEMPDPALRDQLLRIQRELFQLGSELATPAGKFSPIDRIAEPQVTALEQEIDAMEAQLPPLKHFILPGGSKATATIHLARTVCRRAERDVVALHHEEPVRELVLQYLNRLSDTFFVCARYAAHRAGHPDVLWIPR